VLRHAVGDRDSLRFPKRSARGSIGVRRDNANAIHFPQTVTVHGDFVYWTAAGDCPLDSLDGRGSGKVTGARRGDGSTAMSIPDLPCPFGIEAADDDLYWTNRPGFSGGSIWTAKSDGTGVHVFADGLRSPGTIKVDSTSVYWNDDTGIHAQSRTQHESPRVIASIDGLDSNTIQSTLVIDDQYVYWIEPYGFGPGGIFRAEKSGGAPKQLVVDQPLGLAISSAGLFWVEQETFQTYALSFLAPGDQTPTRLTEMPNAPNAPNALSAFGDTAYWVEGSDEEPGSVLGIRIGQSQPFTIATGQSQPNAITADAKYVFWSNVNYPEVVGYDGEVRRACRP